LLPSLFASATRVREHAFGQRVSLCAIVNAKSGLCPEDCAFCAQSAHHSTNAAVYPLLDEAQLLDGAKAAAACGAGCYGIVTSGSGIRAGEELERVCTVIRKIRAEGLIAPGASLGTLDLHAVRALKDAGLVTYHHNLETSRSFFPAICTTHSYDDDVATVRMAKQAGLRVCSGGLFGLGESMAQRVELAFTLKELDVDSVPVNFLDPVAGTPLAGISSLSPLECLHTVALFRMILPDRHITICGGREKNLRELQSWLFLAGASGIMTGNYLTKEGRQPETDRQMIADLGLSLAEELVR
jgi:biotin synthase